MEKRVRTRTRQPLGAGYAVHLGCTFITHVYRPAMFRLPRLTAVQAQLQRLGMPKVNQYPGTSGQQLAVEPSPVNASELVSRYAPSNLGKYKKKRK